MCRTGDEVDFTLPQGFVRLVVREDQPVLRIKSFLGEQIESDGSDGRKVGV